MSTPRRPSTTCNTFALLLLLMECMQFINMQPGEIYVANLTPQCLRCLCVAATNCELTLGCKTGFCGAYKVNREYWADAGKPVVLEDDPERFAGLYMGPPSNADGF